MTSIAWKNGPILRNGAIGTEQACCCGSTPECCPVSLEYVSKGVTFTGKARFNCTKDLQSPYTFVSLISRGSPCQYFIQVSNIYSTQNVSGQCYFTCFYNYEYGPLTIAGSCGNGSGCAGSAGYPSDVTLTSSDFALTSEDCTSKENACSEPYEYSYEPEYWFPDSVSVYYNPLP